MMNFGRHFPFFNLFWQESNLGTDDPPAPAPVKPASMPYYVVMPGKFRPVILISKRGEAEAITALEEVAAKFADAGWSLDWSAEQFCLISKVYPEGLLISRLEVIHSAALFPAQVKP